MNIITALNKLGDLETSVAELYEWYADVFAADREASQAFARMGTEERGHARLVEYQRRVAQRSPARTVEVSVDLAEIESTTGKAKSLRASPRAPQVEEAIRDALEIELSAAEAYYREALKQADPQMAKVLEALAGKDQAHTKRILELAVRRRVPIPAAKAR